MNNGIVGLIIKKQQDIWNMVFFPILRKIKKDTTNPYFKAKTGLSFSIKPKDADYFVGVASLSFINLSQRQCSFSMVIGKKDDSPNSMYYAMETKCRMTEHAFENVGVERITSGQVVDLIKWQRWQVLFGYQIEGIFRAISGRGTKYTT